jgi:hypothetical protein
VTRSSIRAGTVPGLVKAVRYFKPARARIKHPQAGRITLEMFQLRLEDDPGHLLVMQVPADTESRNRIVALLDGDR